LPEFDPITGRYVYLDIAGARNRVYFEEAGLGRPLVCLHTAGADSRQYRHLLCDEQVTSRWHAVAFDLPFHGRSIPPEGWWEREYLLTCEAYAETVMAFVRALGLDRPVVLGCSMGGAVVLELARRHVSEVGAVIGLEAASKIEGRFLDWSLMPDIDGSVMAASWTYGLMAPQSPETARREVWWTYTQGAPGIYRGALLPTWGQGGEGPTYLYVAIPAYTSPWSAALLKRVDTYKGLPHCLYMPNN